MYASAKSRNPGPLDADSVSNEADTSPRAVSLKLDDDTKVEILKLRSSLSYFTGSVGGLINSFNCTEQLFLVCFSLDGVCGCARSNGSQ